MSENYDYIIAGGGMAGLSLAFYLSQSHLRGKKTLVIDRENKTANDRTWCFWEKENSAFDETVFRRWQGVFFHGAANFSAFLNLGEYQYKMIRAADFYRFVREKLAENDNINFLQTDISRVENGSAATGKGIFAAREIVFDSVTPNDYDNENYQNLRQHFLGWTIETDAEIFDAAKPTLFDFRVEQKNECRFVYILPHSANKALVEFTVFSDNLPPRSEYEFYLEKYVSEVLSAKNFRVTETEFGVIPMSDAPHALFPEPKTVRIGTSGGFVKPSTGYTFRRTQNFLQNLVAALEQKPFERVTKTDIFGGNTKNRWKLLLDRVLLDVLRNKRHPAKDVFTTLFARNDASAVLKFLDEDSTLAEDLKIMQTVPLKPFTNAVLAQILKGNL